APGKEPVVARVAVWELLTANPLVRQPAACQLLVAGRPLPNLRRQILRSLFPGGVAHGPFVCRTFLAGSHRERAPGIGDCRRLAVFLRPGGHLHVSRNPAVFSLGGDLRRPGANGDSAAVDAVGHFAWLDRRDAVSMAVAFWRCVEPDARGAGLQPGATWPRL